MTNEIDTLKPGELQHYHATGALPQLIDCRSASEFAAGHVPGSVNIPVEELDVRRHDIDADRPVVFICASGHRARTAAELMAGGTPVAVLHGGIKAWAASGREVIVNAASTWSLERQVRLVAGSLAALGGIASFEDVRFAVVPVLIGLGLTFAAVTNTCAMGEILMLLPWNRRRA